MSHCDSLEIVKNFFQVFKLDIIYIYILFSNRSGEQDGHLPYI